MCGVAYRILIVSIFAANVLLEQIEDGYTFERVLGSGEGYSRILSRSDE